MTARTLDSLLAAADRRDHAFTIYRERGSAAPGPTDIEALFERHGVAFEVSPISGSGSEPFVLIETDGEFAGVIGVAELTWLLDPPIVRPGERDGIASGYRAVFDAFEETVFEALGRESLLAVSREIEDRAYRVASGTLHASFQTLSTFRSQVDVYRHLATETALDIHVHGVGDWEPPEVPGVTYHTVDDDDATARYWALAFDGGGESQACGLLAEERSDGYAGFWTNDAALVGEIAAALTSE